MRCRGVGAFAAFAFAIGCGGEPSGVRVGPPAQLDVTLLPVSSAVVGASAGAFSVKVSDAGGTSIPAVTVAFATTGAATVSPITATTDASGIATTQVTLGTMAGVASVRATVSGLATVVSATITVAAGPAATLAVTPKTARLSAVGDTVRIVAGAQDRYGNATPAVSVAYSVVDATLLVVDQSGLVRALRAGGFTSVIAAAGGVSDTAVVTVIGGGSPCTGLAVPTTVAVGAIQLLSGVKHGCFAGTAAGAEYAIVAFNSSTSPTVSLNVTVTGMGLAAPPSAAFAAPSGAVAEIRGELGTRVARPPMLDLGFHERLQSAAARRFRGGFSRARSARSRATAGASTTTGGFSPSVSRTAIPSTAKVGDLVTLNVSATICENPNYRALRVAAIGSRSIVLADTLNPSGGFSAADYERFSARFDTLVYPLVADAFGAPADIDNNGRVGILFTSAVNELVDSTSGYFVGGFFNPRDLFPKLGSVPADNCAGSNEGEMFYMLVPAPSGIRGVKHSAGFVDSITTAIIAHEFQHLINGSRRVHINTQAEEFEDVWLNEGLSHIAEELLYYRESGKTPRQNLDDNAIRVNSRATYGFWKSDASSNFNRFLSFIRSPGANTLFADNDELPTRGAAWAFLRYAADRLQSTDGTIWQRFGNATTTGLATLQTVYGTAPMPLIRDWAVANYVDDLGITTDPRYLQLSWNYRHIYSNTYGSTNAAGEFVPRGFYPLRVTLMPDNTAIGLQIRGGSASYVKFAVGSEAEALLSFTSGGGVPSSPLQFLVVRTK